MTLPTAGRGRNRTQAVINIAKATQTPRAICADCQIERRRTLSDPISVLAGSTATANGPVRIGAIQQ